MTDVTEPRPAPEEMSVEIHKPKPVHSWREFLKEYAIIVLGVATALAAEQAVEWMHWESEVKEARQSILAEMAANNENLYAYRIAAAPCVQRDLDEAETVLSALEAGLKTEAIKHFSPAPAAMTRDSDWQAERASQVLTHFPRAELALMSQYYAQMADIQGYAIAEGGAFRDLATLQKPLAGMTTSDLILIRNSLRAARAFESLVVTGARRQLRISERLGVPDSKVDPQRVRNYCTMSQEEFMRWRGTQELR